MNTSTLLGLGAACAMSAAVCSAAPLVNISMVVDGGAHDGASTVQVQAGDVVNFRLVADMAPIGTSNINGSTTRTITSLVSGTDGIGSARFNIKQAAADAIQVDFDAAASLQNGYGAGISASGGTVTARASTSNDDLTAIKAVLGTGVAYTGIDGVTLATGSFDVVSMGAETDTTLILTYLNPDQAPGSLKFNGGTPAIASNTNTDPMYGFSGLTLTAVPEPVSAGLLAVGAVGLLGRRRRAL